MLRRWFGSPLLHPVLGRIGGASFLGPSVTLGALVVSFVTSMATFSATSWVEIAWWAIANWASFAIAFIPVAVLWLRRRAGQLLNLGLGSVLAISAGIGFTKTTTVSVTFALLSKDALVIQDLLLRGLAGAVLGIVFLPSLTLAFDSLSELRELRRIVNQHELLSSAGEEPSEVNRLLQILDSELAAVLDQIGSGKAEKVTQTEISSLRSLISNHVRPASKAFWQTSQIQLERLTWRPLLRIGASRKIWIPVVLLPMVSGFVLGSIQGGSDPDELAHALLLMPVLTVVLLVMNRLQTFRLAKPGIWFGVTMFLAGPIAWVITGIVTNQTISQNLGWLLGYIFWLALGSLGTSLGRLILQERRDLLAQLANLKLNLSQLEPAEILKFRKRANQLHGEVQSRLVANVFLAESGESIERSALVAQLLELQKLIREEVPDHNDLPSGLESLSRTWAGFVDIETPSKLQKLDAKLSSRALSVIEEGVQNAYRHGLADLCRLELELNHDYLRIKLIDNGVGVREMEPGVGSALFASEDPQWTITNSAGGGAVLTVTLPIQVKTP